MRLPDWIARSLIEPAWDLHEGSVRLRTYRELARDQFDPLPRLEARRQERLNALVRHAAAQSPFHRRRLEAAGIDPARVRTIEDLRALPLLTKADVREHLGEILAADHPPADLVAARTGGSTGTALLVYCDRRGIERRQGAALLADTWSGWRLGQPMAAVWGNPPRPRSLRNRLRAALKDRILYLDTMRLNEEAVREFLAGWRRLRPGLLFGHAHSLYLLALMLGESGMALRPRGIVATSMMLLQPEREVIERVFGVPVTNRYGCEEVSLIACECERHAGLHVNAEHVALEVLRADGSPCAPGEDGRIVVTEFVNLGMPMLRYEVGDHGALHDAPCPCGRPHALLRSLTGRTADFLVADDGSRVAGISLIENTLTRFPGIAQLQLVQEDIGRLDVNLVRAAGWNEAVAGDLRRAFREALGGDTEITIHFRDAIAQEPNGKYRFSICRVPGLRD
ncbi:MAG: phenylacetate--CoA ligase family protein [Candidatus Eisenbacteria bacterium]